MTRRVLAIDDSPDIHALLRARLRGEDVEVHSATSGREGISLARELRPDLVLLDVDLGDETGFDVIQALKAEPDTADLLVIFLTGHMDVATKVRGLDLGAIDYVTKPFEPTELRARVRAALRIGHLLGLLATRAQLDGLTGLWNRRFFDDRLAAQLAGAARARRPLSMVIADVDRFKGINDTYGHPFGDRVLQAVGESLAGHVRLGDLVCRLGGEEFGIILPDTTPEDAIHAAERLRAAVRATVITGPRGPVPVTASFGVAGCIPGPDLTPVQLYTAADEGLYAAKNGGRDAVRLGALAGAPG